MQVLKLSFFFLGGEGFFGGGFGWGGEGGGGGGGGGTRFLDGICGGQLQFFLFLFTELVQFVAIHKAF